METTNTETKTPTPSESEQQEEIERSEPPPKRAPYIEMAEDESGWWHWCLWSANGRAICIGNSSFKRRNDCMQSVENALEILRKPDLRVVATIGR